MRLFGLILTLGFLSAACAQNGYKYENPIRQTIPIRIQQQQQTNGGIYSPLQSPPLAPVAPPSIYTPQPQQPPAPLPLPIQHPLPQPQQLNAPIPVQHSPISVPQNTYIPPPLTQPIQQNFNVHQHDHQTGFQQSSFVQNTNNYQPIVSGNNFQQSGFQQIGLQHGGNVQHVNHFQDQTHFHRPQTAIVTKDIYIHSAPDDHEEISLGPQIHNAPVRKNYRIVFIKAPSQNFRLNSAALKQAQTANEDKTVIYVLSKKPDLTDVHQQIQQIHTAQKAHKPEVYFIKYKTAEEAQRAQQEIQAQYDALGGSTHISDEGIAPITSVIGHSGGSSSGINLGTPVERGALNLALPIIPGPVTGTTTGNHQQQSFSHQSFQSGGGSSISFGSGPSARYLPVKALKKRDADDKQ